MDSVFSFFQKLWPAGIVVEAISGSLLGIGVLVGFIIARRTLRARHFRQREKRSLTVRGKWEAIVSGKIPPKLVAQRLLQRERRLSAAP